MNAVSLLPLEYKLEQTKKQKHKRYLEKLVLASIVIFAMLVLGSVALFVTSKIIYSLNKTNSDLISQISLYGDYAPVVNQIDSQTSQVQAAIGTYPDMVWLMSEIAKAVPNGTGISDIDIKYDGKAGSCTIVGKSASHSMVSQFVERLGKINGLSLPQCTYSKSESTMSEFKITVTVQNNIPQKLKAD